MKATQVPRIRLRNTGLSPARFDSPEEVVRAHLAMQSQDFGPAKWSVGQRLKGVTDPVIQASFDDGSILRTHVLRPTWHFVARADLRWLMELSGPRVQQKCGPRYAELGLDAKVRARAERVIVRELEGGASLTRKELERVLSKNRLRPEGQRLPYFLTHCELEGVVCSGPLSGKQQTYALLDERAPRSGSFVPANPVAELVVRYLGTHGPATVADMAWWSGLKMSDLRAVLTELDEVASEEVDGVTLWTIDGGCAASGRSTAVHLLQAYDELIVGFTESRYLGDERARAARAAFKDRSMPTGVVLLGSSVGGHWRRRIDDRRVDVEVLLYDRPGATTERRIAAAADELGSFVDREVRLEIGMVAA